jgi:3-deoxy-D-manno-octulosonate 8-phosphate phosphatase (KDO 8-P phosphatase)
MAKSQSRIKLVLFDISGVLIKENSNSTNEEILSNLKKLTQLLNTNHIHTGVLSIKEESVPLNAFNNSVVNFVILSQLNKEDSLLNFIKDKYSFEEIFYIADDLLDVPVLQKVGISASPMSARREVKRIVNFVIRKEDPVEIINEVKTIVLQNV